MMVSSLLACCGAKDINLIENSYGEKGMPKSILVVYGTWAGSTAEVADFIGRTVAEGGYRVDVKPVESVKSLAGYHAVVIGSAIRAGKVKPEVMDFVKNHKSALEKIPSAYFVVCMTMKDDTPDNRKTVNAYLDPLREQVAPVDAGLFAGKMDYSKLGFFARMAVKYFVKVPEGDFRNWNVIKAWTRSLIPKLALSPGRSS
ncbi:MAG TPA: flavodoxin domain-containing protein [Desulfomonilia bacterium]|nr:flavodoxin domain-containing protein [Desulfomonilia bacterium]